MNPNLSAHAPHRQYPSAFSASASASASSCRISANVSAMHVGQLHIVARLRLEEKHFGLIAEQYRLDPPNRDRLITHQKHGVSLPFLWLFLRLTESPIATSELRWRASDICSITSGIGHQTFSGQLFLGWLNLVHIFRIGKKALCVLIGR